MNKKLSLSLILLISTAITPAMGGVINVGGVGLSGSFTLKGSSSVTSDGVELKNGSSLTGKDLTIQGKSGSETARSKGMITVESGASFETDSLSADKGNTSGNGGALNNKGTFTQKTTGSYTDNKAKEGGAVYNEGTASFKGETSFSSDSADEGGALYNKKGTNGNSEKGQVTFEKKATFENNKATGTNSKGGAVYNAGDLTFSDSAAFTGNNASTSNGQGGALYNEGKVTFNGENTFEKNEAENSGGAIYNASDSIDMKGTNVFKDNKSKSAEGGAVLNNGSITFDGVTEFTGNQASGSIHDNIRGGAVSNHKDLTIKGTSSTFKNNKSEHGGAIYNNDYKHNGTTLNADLKIETENNLFEGNIANGSTYKDSSEKEIKNSNGGAIWNGAGKITITGHSQFKSNQADLGGAISNSGTMTLGESVFEGNKASVEGGAVLNGTNGSNLEFTDSVKFSKNESNLGGAVSNIGKLTMKDAEFTENKATSNGGAVFNNDGAEFNITDSATFTDNQGTFGGAVTNFGNMTMADATFKNNKSNNEAGGALVNGAGNRNGTLTFTGNVLFQDNTAEGLGGAIFNRTRSAADAQKQNVELKGDEGKITFEGEVEFKGNKNFLCNYCN